MYEKSGKFYADWRDKRGTRHRKSFSSARAALRFEAEQKELAHPKKKAQAKAWPTSCAYLRKAHNKTIAVVQPRA